MRIEASDPEGLLTGFSITGRPLLFVAGLVLVIGIPVAWAVAAYLEGYGVPVGMSLLLGAFAVPAVLFAGAAVASVAMNVRYGRMTQELRSTGESGPAWDRESMEAASALMEDFERSVLTRVIGVGATRRAEDVDVELLAVELRDSGGAISLRASGRLPVPRPGEIGMPSPDVSLGDDVGTRYTVVPAGGSGGQYAYAYEFRFAPAPPPAATVLNVGISRFSPWMKPASSHAALTNAPWGFSVPLQPNADP